MHYLFLLSISSRVMLLVSKRNLRNMKNPAKVITEKNAKLSPIPNPSPKAPATIGKRKVILPLTIQTAKDPMATPPGAYPVGEYLSQ